MTFSSKKLANRRMLSETRLGYIIMETQTLVGNTILLELVFGEPTDFILINLRINTIIGSFILVLLLKFYFNFPRSTPHGGYPTHFST